MADDASRYLSTAEAAATLAVSVSTVKRWVDEKVLPAHVTAGGHRKLLRSEVMALARRGDLPAGDPPPPGKAGDPEAAATALGDALAAGDSRTARAVIRRTYEAGLPIESLADQVIAPAMARIGHEWELEKLDVWQEHRGTEICVGAMQELLGQLEFRAEQNRPVAVGCAPEGDPYVLPSRLAQFVLLDSGWDAVNLGPNTPLASLSKAVRELRPRLVWLSISHLEDAAAFTEAYRKFYAVAERQGVAVAIGGSGLPAEVRSPLSYTTHGDGLTHLAAFARTLHPRPRRPRRGRPPLRAP